MNLNDVLACVNNEYKCAISLGLDNLTWKTTNEIAKSVNKFLGMSFFKNGEFFRTYFATSIVNQGFVDKKRVGNKIHYRLSKKGVKYFVPVSNYILNSVPDLGYSIALLGGANYKNKINSCFMKYLILRELNINESINIQHFINILKKDLNIEKKTSQVSYLFTDLQKNDLITYESLNFENSGFSKYYWCNKGIPNLKNNPKITLHYSDLTNEVINILSSEKKSMSSSNIYNKLELKDKISENSNYNGIISNILSNLMNEGYVKCTSTFRGGYKHSHAVITNKGKNFYDSILVPINDFVQNSVCNSVDFSNFKINIVKSLDLYENFRKKKINEVSTKKDILNYISDNGKQRPRDLVKVGFNSVTRNLKKLIIDGSLKKLKDPNSKAVYYCVR